MEVCTAKGLQHILLMTIRDIPDDKMNECNSEFSSHIMSTLKVRTEQHTAINKQMHANPEILSRSRYQCTQDDPAPVITFLSACQGKQKPCLVAETRFQISMERRNPHLSMLSLGLQ